MTTVQAALAVPSPAEPQTVVQRSDWGRTQAGQSVDLWKLSNAKLTITVTTFGAHLVSVLAPDRDGHNADVVLGYKDLQGYEADSKTYIGAIVGRYGNRIGKGQFSLDGEHYQIPQNNNGNALHGGAEGFDRKVWRAKAVPRGVELTLVSPDGDMGFPGKVTVHVRYTLLGDSLHIDYAAMSDKATVLNLTNHSYFNLAGESSGSILDHLLTLHANNITPVDAGLIPTGKLMPVAGTPFDFRTQHRIGERIGADDEQLKVAGGYDHNFVLTGHGLRRAAYVVDPHSGRTLSVSTTEPGVQFYSGNFLEGATTGVGGVAYAKYAGLCLETQHFPDSPNEPAFPSTVLRPGQTMHSTTTFTFGVADHTVIVKGLHAKGDR